MQEGRCSKPHPDVHNAIMPKQDLPDRSNSGKLRSTENGSRPGRSVEVRYREYH